MSGHETLIAIDSEPEQSEEQQLQERTAKVCLRLVVSGNGGVPLSGGQAICPVTVRDHLSLMSIAFFIGNKADAVIWHGPMKYTAIRPLLSDMGGGGLDYVLVDCPPGAGNEPLTAAQLIGRPAAAVVVATPQELRIANARRSATFCQQAELPIPIDPRIVGCSDREECLFGADSQSLATQTYLALAGRLHSAAGMWASQ